MANLGLILAALLGVLLGILYAFSGFSPGKTEKLQENPRVLNLLWLVGGAVAIIFVDWSLFSGTELTAEQKFQFTASYAVAALATAFVAVALLSIGVYLHASGKVRSGSLPGGAAFDLLVRYLHGGFGQYSKHLASLEKTEPINPAAQISRLAGAVTTAMAIASADRDAATTKPKRQEHIGEILKAMESTVQLLGHQIHDLHVTSNYMVRVEQAKLPAGMTPLFKQPSPPECYLVLRRYRLQQGPEVCIPVAARKDRPGSLLPGAPTAFAENQPEVINSKKVQFKKGVTDKVKKEIVDYFRGVSFVSVLSVPIIIDNGEIIGVVNIESNKVDLVGGGRQMILNLFDALSPFCLILGEIIARAEKGP